MFDFLSSLHWLFLLNFNISNACANALLFQHQLLIQWILKHVHWMTYYFKIWYYVILFLALSNRSCEPLFTSRCIDPRWIWLCHRFFFLFYHRVRNNILAERSIKIIWKCFFLVMRVVNELGQKNHIQLCTTYLVLSQNSKAGNRCPKVCI